MMRRRPRRGFALLTALALTALIGVLAWTFQEGMQFHWTVARTTSWEAQAHYLAEAGIAEARAALAAGEDVAPLWQEHEIGDGLVRVSVTSAAARLHLNKAPASEVARLLGVSAEQVEAGRPLASVHDALAAWDLSPDQYDTAVIYGTVAGDGGIDFNAAPVEVLRALDGVSPELAQAIVTYRDSSPGTALTARNLAAVPGIGAGLARSLAARATDDDSWQHVVAEGRVVHGMKQRRTARLDTVLHHDGRDWRMTEPVGWTPAW